jgi:energy-coupling factor transporter ATP-binding protein EcfA2
MYLSRVKFANVRSLSEVDWHISPAAAPGWHVIIGDNGSGKSSFLRSIALGMIGNKYAEGLRQDWNTWLRRGEKVAEIEADLLQDSRWDQVVENGIATSQQNWFVQLRLEQTLSGVDLISAPGKKRRGGHDLYDPRVLRNGGWFSAAYGPFRRFTGGSPEDEVLLQSNPRLARHLSVFSESTALTESLRWLQQLEFERLEEEKSRPGTFWSPSARS